MWWDRCVHPSMCWPETCDWLPGEPCSPADDPRGVPRVEPQVLDFRYGPRGKPELAPRFGRAGLQFNASHSEGVGLYAVTAWRRVGVDIERVRPMPDLEAIAERRFSLHEQGELRRLAPGL